MRSVILIGNNLSKDYQHSNLIQLHLFTHSFIHSFSYCSCDNHFEWLEKGKLI